MRLIKDGHRGRSTLIAVAVLLSVAGLTLLLVFAHAQSHAPRPPASAAGTYAAGTQASGTPTQTSSPITGQAVKGPILRESIPTHLTIPAIDVDTDLIQLGLNRDRSVQVPPLGPDSKAGWYRYSPSPGQLGPSILLGHIDSARYGPGVFYNLGALRKGNSVTVRRADNTVAIFRIDAVAEYPKNQFPTLTVYGNTDHAALRLITCGGKFDLSAHSYEDNIVAFASLVTSRKA